MSVQALEQFLRHSKVLTRVSFFDGVIVDLNPCIYAYCHRTKEYTTQSAHIKLNPFLMSRSRISCLLFFLLCWWLIVLSLMYEYVQFTLTYISIASFVQAEVL